MNIKYENTVNQSQRWASELQPIKSTGEKDAYGRSVTTGIIRPNVKSQIPGANSLWFKHGPLTPTLQITYPPDVNMDSSICWSDPGWFQNVWLNWRYKNHRCIFNSCSNWLCSLHFYRLVWDQIKCSKNQTKTQERGRGLRGVVKGAGLTLRRQRLKCDSFWFWALILLCCETNLCSFKHVMKHFKNSLVIIIIFFTMTYFFVSKKTNGGNK